MNFLITYRSLLDISRQMLTLAEQQQWEQLSAMETQRAGLIGGLPRNSGIPPANRQEIAEIIDQIQALDREIMEYVEPWREHAALLLERFEHTSSKSA